MIARPTKRALIVIAIAGLVPAVTMIAMSGDDERGIGEPGSRRVKVVQGRTVFVGSSAGDVPAGAGPAENRSEQQAEPASEDLAVMRDAMAAEPADGRATGDERRLLAAIRSGAPTLMDPAVVCSTTTCRVTGDLPIAAEAARTLIRAPSLLEPIALLGYSPGPDELESRPPGARVLMYLNREN